MPDQIDQNAADIIAVNRIKNLPPPAFCIQKARSTQQSQMMTNKGLGQSGFLANVRDADRGFKAGNDDF